MPSPMRANIWDLRDLRDAVQTSLVDKSPWNEDRALRALDLALRSYIARLGLLPCICEPRPEAPNDDCPAHGS